jgi:hypothetical protein
VVDGNRCARSHSGVRDVQPVGNVLPLVITVAGDTTSC